MLTDVAGVAVGHWTDPAARTGCTVVLLPDGSVASGEVRGGAPGTREWDLLAPERLVTHIDAVVLTGGSAFGLAACDGVARWCEEQGRGFETRAARVPIVVGAVLYDLGVGDPAVRPGPEEGYAAARAATTGRFRTGPVGAGTGATVGAWRRAAGRGRPRRGGLGTATVRHGDLVVSALFAVNAYGDVVPAGVDPAEVADLAPLLEVPAAAAFQAAPSDRPPGSSIPPADGRPDALQQTTIGVVVTNARLDKAACLLVSQSAHDGMARALEPAHTTVDGDAVVVASVPGPGDSPAVRLDGVRAMAARATTAAIRASVRPRRAGPGNRQSHR